MFEQFTDFELAQDQLIIDGEAEGYEEATRILKKDPKRIPKLALCRLRNVIEVWSKRDEAVRQHRGRLDRGVERAGVLAEAV